MALNPRQQAFVEHYVALGNATRAAKAAGYSEKTAYQQGHMLLKHPEVAATIDERQTNLANAMGLTRQRVLAMHEEVYALAVQGSPRFDKDGNEIGTDRQLTAANRAAELIGKTHGMYTDRATLDIGATVVYQLAMGGADIDTELEEDDEP